jgi:DNA-directed RNA polymerase subunit L/DNA-directed RNA polymerase alpha subunit
MQVQTPMATASKVAASRSKIRVVPKLAVEASGSPFQNLNKVGENTLTFTLTPTHVSYANTLRRAVLTMVETVAFNADIQDSTGKTTDVSITKNSTPMSNEMLAHRIGLLPLQIKKPLLWKPEEYIFSINVKNDSTDSMDITADNIIVKRVVSTDEEPQMVPSREFFYPNRLTGDTPLITVLKGKVGAQKPEELECSMVARLGTGRQNARYIPVSQCSYKYTSDMNKDKRKEVFDNWLLSSKKVIASDLETNTTRKEELEREFNTMEAARCYLEQNGEPYSFDFTVESIGVLTPEVILARALDVLVTRCLRYASINVGDLPDNLRVVPSTTISGNAFDFLFAQEDHTLGNLFQTWIEQNLMNAGAGAEPDVSFTGYKVPHPLRDEMVLTVGVEKDGQQVTARSAVSRAAKGCADLFTGWRAALEPYVKA